MLQKLKKIPSYALKIIKRGNYLDLIRIVKHVKLSYILPALAAHAKKQSAAIEIRNQPGFFDLQTFLAFIPCRRARLFKNFRLWKYKERRFCATYTQFSGLYTDCLSDQFNEYFHLDWKNKRVLDVGGFVGDSALYMLERGATQIFIYEPIPENILALHYNLQPYKEKVQVYQKAVAQSDGPVTLSSCYPAGSPGFGIEEGAYQIQCEGISLSRMLAQHQVDIIKMDCEGGEKYIIDLSTQELQSVPYWIVETHNTKIYGQILNKFESEGFSKVKEVTLTPEVSLLHFANHPT